MASKFLSNTARSVKKVLLPLYMAFRKNRRYEPLTGREDGIVVSLTAIPSRIETLWITMDSLFGQKVRPDIIILVLSEQDFPGGMESLPESVTRLREYGLRIVFEKENLLCHKKYRWTFMHHPDSTVITVDDDCYYRSDMISRLVDLSRKYPGTVCANVAAVINMDHFYEYKTWKKSGIERGADPLCVAIGFAGVLYPPHIFSELVFDTDTLTKLSPRADDLWLKACELMCGVSVSCGGFYPKPLTIIGSQKVSLRKTNKGSSNMNDVQWKALDGHFKLRDRLK